jgi:uncharacterized membrane protein
MWCLPPQGSVWGSGLAGMACAVAALATGVQEPWRIGFVASFVSKLSDTVSSEIGKVCSCPLPSPEQVQSQSKEETQNLLGIPLLGIHQAYGQTTYLITTLQRVPRGTEGAISAEGTLAGALAAVSFAVIAYAVQQVGALLSA